MNTQDHTWNRKQQRCELLASGIPEHLVEAILNLLELYSMEVFAHNYVSSQWVVRFQRHRGAFYYVIVGSPHAREFISPWLHACQEVEAAFGHKP